MALLATFPAPRLVASRLLGARSLRTVGSRHNTAFGLHARASAADKQDTKVEFRVISGKSWLIVGDDAPVGRRRPLPLVRPPPSRPDASAVPAPPFFRNLRSYRIQGTVVARPISESAPERTDVLGSTPPTFSQTRRRNRISRRRTGDERTETPRSTRSAGSVPSRGAPLSNLGGSSPMNLFGFLEQLGDAMETDLAGESPRPAPRRPDAIRALDPIPPSHVVLTTLSTTHQRFASLAAAPPSPSIPYQPWPGSRSDTRTRSARFPTTSTTSLRQHRRQENRVRHHRRHPRREQGHGGGERGRGPRAARRGRARGRARGARRTTRTAPSTWCTTDRSVGSSAIFSCRRMSRTARWTRR